MAVNTPMGMDGGMAREVYGAGKFSGDVDESFTIMTLWLIPPQERIMRRKGVKICPGCYQCLKDG